MPPKSGRARSSRARRPLVIMYELTRTSARAAFKDLLGQANHFLITLLIGVNAVRDGTATLGDEFRATWNPRDVRSSAERSRQFVLDLALVRAVDALDTYMMWTRRRPTALTSKAFKSEMDGAGQKISSRLAVFADFLPPLPDHQNLFLKLAIDRRNRRVHSLADEMMTSTEEQKLLSHANKLEKEHSGLDVKALMERYHRRESPSFKDAASVIRLTHFAVEHFDEHLLKGLNIEEYVRGLMMFTLAPGWSAERAASLKHACAKTWGDKNKRQVKALRILMMAGVHPTVEIKGREVPSALIDKITRMCAEQAYEYLSS